MKCFTLDTVLDVNGIVLGVQFCDTCSLCQLVNFCTLVLHASHSGTVVPECCKDDYQSQWENLKFDPYHTSWQGFVNCTVFYVMYIIQCSLMYVLYITGWMYSHADKGRLQWKWNTFTFKPNWSAEIVVTFRLPLTVRVSCWLFWGPSSWLTINQFLRS